MSKAGIFTKDMTLTGYFPCESLKPDKAEHKSDSDENNSKVTDS